MAAASSSPHSPPTSIHQSDEACQGFFVTQLVSTLLLGLSILFVSRKTAATPREDHDRPWGMVKLLLDVGFWYSAPATLIFLVFEVLVPRNSFTHSYEMVCMQVASSSSFPWVMLLFAWCTANVSLSLQRAHLAAEINSDVGLAPSNHDNEDDEDESPKMLMIGGLAFGLIFDAIQSHQKRHMKPAPIMVDHAGQKQYILDKVAALNLVDGKKQAHNGADCGHYVLPLAAEKLYECILDPVQIEGYLLLGVPLQTNSVDKVVVTPGFRDCDDHTTAGQLCCAVGRSSSCWKRGITLSGAFQFAVWVGLVFSAAGCYSYLMFKPSRNTLPFAQLSMFFPILTTVYPVVAHGVRYRIKYIIIDDHTERIINHGWHRSSCAACCKTFAKGLLCEVSGIGAAFLFSVVDWVFMYVAQLLLRLIVEDVGNSLYAVAVVGPLGLVLTLVLAMKLHHDHALRVWKRELTSREIDPEKFKQLQES